ncbi:protein UXT-like [Lingula anatina]|uniref:Protein UXT-like n=1 Tax=Lingula anatina TaxID=7574 RepID=A0A1S3K532_LINAN|nr:protein UXT-like [Lingula anatina]|eukprot:XP_013417371.2 protein UXT-like [Lingula anatina]
MTHDKKKVLDERDKIYSQMSEYLQLQTIIEKLQDTNLTEEPIRTKIDLGCNFYVQAKVPDASKIFVSVGFGFFVEFTLPEAIRFIDKKMSHLNEISAKLTHQASEIKGHIKLVLEGIRELQHLDDGIPPSQTNIRE